MTKIKGKGHNFEINADVVDIHPTVKIGENVNINCERIK